MKNPKLSDILTAKDSSEISLDDLRSQISKLAAADDRFKETSAENGDKICNPCGPWVDNIIFDDGEWSAIVCAPGSKLWEVGFTVEDGAVSELLDDAKEVKRKTSYVAASEPFKFNGAKVSDAEGEIVKAASVGIPTHSNHRDNLDLVICKDAGVPLAEKKWEFGKPVEFMWAPGGKTVITAGCAGRSLRLWVIGDAKGASDVQTSFATAVAASPRRLPYGCIEHQEKERAFEPKQFAWKESPEPGIYCSAIPTKLGESNVNGRMQTSFSPCFRHDARFSTAVCTDCGEGATVCKCDGTLEFPNGVRGSESNPAHIVGVFEKSVGSLTNWPAFKDILPVTAKEPPVKAGAPAGNKNAEGSHHLMAVHNSAQDFTDFARGKTQQAEIHSVDLRSDGRELKTTHNTAAMLHRHARDAHREAAAKHEENAEMLVRHLNDHAAAKISKDRAIEHRTMADSHHSEAMYHVNESMKLHASEPVKPTLETIYAKHAGEVVTQIDDVVKAGDYPLHPFRGNQYMSGEGEGSHHRSSHRAHISSRAASTKKEHREAAEKHELAAKAWEKQDNGDEASDYHRTMSEFHKRTAAKKKTPTRASDVEKPTLETIFAKRPARPSLETIYARGVNGQPAGRN